MFQNQKKHQIRVLIQMRIGTKVLEHPTPHRASPTRNGIPALSRGETIVTISLGIAFGDVLEGRTRVGLHRLVESGAKEAERWETSVESVVHHHRKNPGGGWTRFARAFDGNGADVRVGAVGGVVRRCWGQASSGCDV